jgi:hypothetical protein
MIQKVQISNNDDFTVGVISDTHGLIRPEVLSAFENVDLIVHAGDIGKPNVLDELEYLAPVVPVRGNMDYYNWAGKLPAKQLVEMGNFRLYLLHDLYDLDIIASDLDIDFIIFGHTHRTHIEKKDGVYYINPGSAGPVRGDRPPTVMRIHIKNGQSDIQTIKMSD